LGQEGAVVSLVGLVALVAAVAAASLFWLLRNRGMGRLRESGEERLAAGQLGAARLGERATLVQFSSAFCRPCVATRQLLTDVAGRVPGVSHLEVDAESHLDLVRALDIASTPTTLLLDRDGVVRRRAVGLPRRAEVMAALADVVH
jgi:thiol-disulfide isomerase/thioredoxin